jgi:hypothetical protein
LDRIVSKRYLPRSLSVPAGSLKFALQDMKIIGECGAVLTGRRECEIPGLRARRTTC